MPSEVADLWVKLSLLSTGFSEGLAESSAEAEGFSAKVSKVGNALAGMAKAGVVAGAGMAAISVKMAGDWQQSMIKLVTSAGEAGSVVDGKLAGPIAQVSDGLLKMAVDTGTSTKSLADGMYFVESAGFHGAAGLQVMKAAAEGARAEGADLSTVADALTTALHDMGEGANFSVPMMNMMIRAVGDGKMTMEQFSGSLHSVLPQAHQAGISFSDVAGAIATMTVAGTTADNATQMLGHTIGTLQGPNALAVKYLGQMGIASTDLSANLGQRGLLGTVTMLDQAILSHMGKDGLVLQSAFNQSKTAGQDLSTMLGQMPSKLRDWSVAVENGSMSAKDYTTAIKGLPANLYAQGAQFLTVYKNATSFNTALRQGGPQVDTFAAALRKATGDQVTANTLMQIGGSNLAYFAQTANDVAAAGQNAGANIETWSTIQRGFNFRIDQAKEAIATTAIRVGTDLLPKLMDLFDLASSRGGPVLHQLEQDMRNALDSPAVHEAESIIGQFLRDFVGFAGDATRATLNLWHAVQPLATQLATGLFAGLKLVGGFLKNDLGPALVAVTGFFRDHATVIKDLADVALAALIAKLLYTKTLLAFDMFAKFVNGIGNAITGIASFGKAVASGQIFDTIRLKAMYAADAVRGLGAAETAAGEGAAAAGGMAGIGGMVGKIGMLAGGGALIGGAIIGVSALANWVNSLGTHASDATADLNNMTSQLLDMANSGSAANTQMAKMAIFATKNGNYGLNLFGGIDAALAQMVQSGNLKQAQAGIAAIDQQLTNAGLSTDKFHNSLTKFSDAAAAYVNQQREAAISTQGLATATSNGTSALESSTSALGDNSTALDGASSTLDGTTGATNSLADATSALMQQQQDMSKGLNADRALDDYNRALQNLTQSLHDNGTAITGTSTAAMNNRDALRQAVQAIIDNYNAQVNLTGDTDAATQKLKDQITQLENQKGMSQQTKDAIKAYVDQLNLIPPTISTTVTANTTQATKQVQDLQNRLKNLQLADNTGSSSASTSSVSTGGAAAHRLPTYGLGGYVNAPKGHPQLAVVHGGEFILSNDMLDAQGGGVGAGVGNGGGISYYTTINVQGSILAEQDLRNVVETQMLQQGGRRSKTYAPYQR